jgi:ATP-dependent HslUV protease ATP-binding subunit HslU
MIGPTGVGKTEIARRLARLAQSPFVKVEASKFTEVGYVGRDVESMVRDLVDAAINMVRGEREDDIYPEAERRAEERLLDLLLPPRPAAAGAPPAVQAPAASDKDAKPLFLVSAEGEVTQKAAEEDAKSKERRERTREKLRAMLRDGKLEERDVEVEITQESFPPMDMMQPPEGPQGPETNIMDMIKEMLPKRKKRRTVHVHDARRLLIDEELRKMVDMDDVVNEALDRVENHGMIFIDEIDKIAGERGAAMGPDVSREGVQRDLLPIVEGSTVQTRYGLVRTDHVLFIAAGAFHVSKPSDLIPELQGRFPIRVELGSLSEDDFIRIMTEPENALTKQYAALCAAEGATLEFSEDGIREVARIAMLLNERLENIGARRLHTVLTTLLEDTLFELPNLPEKLIRFDRDRVKERLDRIVEDEDLRKYIL